MGASLSKLLRTAKRKLRKRKVVPPQADTSSQQGQATPATNDTESEPSHTTPSNVITIDATRPDPIVLESASVVPVPRSGDPVAQVSDNVNAVVTEPDSVEILPLQRQGTLGTFRQQELVAPSAPFTKHHNQPVNGEKRDSAIFDAIPGSEIRSSILWGQAIAILRTMKIGEIDAHAGEVVAPVECLLNDVKLLKKKVDSKRFSRKNDEGEDVFIADKIFAQLNKYAKIGDIALQHHPDVVALVWAGFRLLLNFGTQYTENLERIVSSLGYLAWIICCGAIYEQLYVGTNQTSKSALQDCLVDQYVSILKYLLHAKQHLEQGFQKRLMNSLSSKLASLLSDVQRSEQKTRERAELAEKEAAHIDRSRQNKSTHQLKEELKNVNKQLRVVEEQVNGCCAQLQRVFDFVEGNEFNTTLEWVSTIQYGKIHEEYCKQRSRETCLWLGENSKFADWFDCRSTSSVIWLRGDAGTGKTILASYAIELLRTKVKTTDQTFLAYFYCSKTVPERSAPSSIMRGVLKQLCHAYWTASKELPISLVEIKERRLAESAGLLSIEESGDLIITLSHARVVQGLWIVIDGLDECDQDTRKDLFQALERIQKYGRVVRIFVTGRNEGDVEAYMRKYDNFIIEPQDSASDIQRYIREELGKLYRDPSKERLVEQMKIRENNIIEALMNGAKGMFLSIHLRMEALSHETTMKGIENAMKAFPNGLSNMYDDIFRRISEQKSDTDSETARKVVQWLFYALDDFTPATILEALKDEDATPNFDATSDADDTSMTVEDIVYICRGLVNHDRETGVLRFSHATVREYLSQGLHKSLARGHQWISQLCLMKLISPVPQPPKSLHLEPTKKDLRTYSIRNWGFHLQASGTGTLSSWSSFLDPSSDHYKNWASDVGTFVPVLRGPPGGDGISIVWAACYYRLSHVFENNLDSVPCSVNSVGRNTLHHSAEKGYLDFLKVLLNQGVIDINSTDDAKLTPLILAVQSNNPQVVKLLLGLNNHQVDVNKADKHGRTALMYTSIIGNADIARQLLTTGIVYIDQQDSDGYTALHHAASGGHSLIVDLLIQDQVINMSMKSGLKNEAPEAGERQSSGVVLTPTLERGVYPNLRDSRKETALMIAARLEHQEVVRRLISNEMVDVNCVDDYSYTLLIRAVEENKQWLVTLLLKRKALNINHTDSHQETAVSKAAKSNSLEILQCLLNQPGVIIDNLNLYGETPLILAATQGHSEIVRALLEVRNRTSMDSLGDKQPSAQCDHALNPETRGVDINAKSTEGITALHRAAIYNHIDPLQALLSHGADVNAVTTNGLTALHYAAMNGHTDSLQALLSHGADVNAVTTHGLTALHFAATFGHTDSLQALLSHGADVNAVTTDGLTALHCAATNGHTDSLQALLSHGADVNAVRTNGLTALHCAATNGHTDSLQALLSHGADVNAITTNGLTALHFAAKNGHTDSLQALLSHGGDVNAVTTNGLTALHPAAINGHTDSLQALLSHGADVNAVRTNGHTALHYAAMNGHTDSLQALLSHGADVNAVVTAVELEGFTALHCAATKGHTDSLQALLSHGADVNAVTTDGLTALHYAARKGRIESVQALLSHREDSKINPKVPDNHNSTALLIAAECGFTDIFELILERYDESDRSQEIDNDGTNLLQAAAVSGNLHLIQLILRRFDCDINYVDKNGDSAIANAALKGHAGAIEVLMMEDGVDIDIANNKGKTAFDIAKERNDERVMALLQKKGTRMQAEPSSSGGIPSSSALGAE